MGCRIAGAHNPKHCEASNGAAGRRAQEEAGGRRAAAVSGWVDWGIHSIANPQSSRQTVQYINSRGDETVLHCDVCLLTCEGWIWQLLRRRSSRCEMQH